MGRRNITIVLTDEQKKQKQKDYHKTYYEEYKTERLSAKVIENAIKRIQRDDRFILEFIESIGADKMYELLEENYE